VPVAQGGKDVLSVEDWAEIRRLHFAEGLGTKTIAKRLGVARNTVRSAIRSASPPAYQRARQSSAVDPYEPAIRELLRDFSEGKARKFAFDLASMSNRELGRARQDGSGAETPER
jgi:IS30 family transposase